MKVYVLIINQIIYDESIHTTFSGVVTDNIPKMIDCINEFIRIYHSKIVESWTNPDEGEILCFKAVPIDEEDAQDSCDIYIIEEVEVQS